MPKTIKTSMFSSGTVLVHEGEGKVRKAGKAEITQHLASQLPKQYKGEKLSDVMYDPSDRCVYGKYESKKIKRQIFASEGKQNEPVNSVDKAKPSAEVPEKAEKAKPETQKIITDRPDVGKPKKVRDENYQRGKGGEDLHSDVVPRSKSNSGLEGSKATDYDKEVADKATSGNPDSYVQEFTDSEKPAPAGSEANHAAGSEIIFKSEAEMYQKLSLAGEEEEKEEKKESEEKSEKSKDKPKKKLPPWLEDKDESDEESTEKESQLLQELKEAKNQITAKEAEINRQKIAEARTKAAIGYALALMKLNPTKYADAEVFTETVENTAKRMDVESIKTATEETVSIKREAEQAKAKEKQVSAGADGGLATAMVIQAENSVTEKTGELKEILQSGTTLGRKMAEFENYVPHTKE